MVRLPSRSEHRWNGCRIHSVPSSLRKNRTTVLDILVVVSRMLPVIVLHGSRDNTLYIDGQSYGYNQGALMEVVIICIYEELVTQEFAPPQELPLSTTCVHVI